MITRQIKPEWTSSTLVVFLSLAALPLGAQVPDANPCSQLSAPLPPGVTCVFQEANNLATLGNLGNQTELTWQNLNLPETHSLDFVFQNPAGSNMVINTLQGSGSIAGTVNAPHGHLVFNSPDADLAVSGHIAARDLTVIMGAGNVDPAIFQNQEGPNFLFHSTGAGRPQFTLATGGTLTAAGDIHLIGSDVFLDAGSRLEAGQRATIVESNISQLTSEEGRLIIERYRGRANNQLDILGTMVAPEEIRLESSNDLNIAGATLVTRQGLYNVAGSTIGTATILGPDEGDTPGTQPTTLALIPDISRLYEEDRRKSEKQKRNQQKRQKEENKKKKKKPEPIQRTIAAPIPTEGSSFSNRPTPRSRKSKSGKRLAHVYRKLLNSETSATIEGKRQEAER